MYKYSDNAEKAKKKITGQNEKRNFRIVDGII